MNFKKILEDLQKGPKRQYGTLNSGILFYISFTFTQVIALSANNKDLMIFARINKKEKEDLDKEF